MVTINLHGDVDAQKAAGSTEQSPIVTAFAKVADMLQLIEQKLGSNRGAQEALCMRLGPILPDGFHMLAEEIQTQSMAFEGTSEFVRHLSTVHDQLLQIYARMSTQTDNVWCIRHNIEL
jgi:hypothetical protein